MARHLQYQDFTLRFFVDPNQGLSVRVESAPYGGVQEAPCRLPMAATELDKLFRDLEIAFRGQGSPTEGVSSARDIRVVGKPSATQPLDPRELGTSLYEALLPPPIRGTFVKCLAWMDSDPHRALRLRMIVDPEDPELTAVRALPWELLYRQETRDFLSRSLRTPVVRHLDSPQLRARDLPKPPLKVLIASANPKGTEALDLIVEQRNIASALAARRDVDVEVLPNAGLTDLRRALRRHGSHVLHFMGHGSFDPRTGQGALFLEGTDGSPVETTGHVLAESLKDCRELRLVFLNACETGRLPRRLGQDPYSGVASALVSGGIPAVVCMQLPISDSAAIELSQAFYEALASGDLIESALVEGRLAVHRDEPESWEWAIPAMYMSAPEGRILEPAAQESSMEPRETLIAPVVKASRGVVVGRRVKTKGLHIGKPPVK